MYRLNPLSIVDMDQEDLQKIVEANQLLGGGQQQQQQQTDPRAEALGQARQQVEQMINSEEFQRLPEDKKKAAMAQIEAQLSKLGQAK